MLADSGLDAVILEVGLGGRLDAVNIVDTDCAIVTSIDLDHMDYLGPDRESIGREKAGIMRTGRAAVVSDPNRPPPLRPMPRPLVPTCGYSGEITTTLVTASNGHGRAFQTIQWHGFTPLCEGPTSY